MELNLFTIYSLVIYNVLNFAGLMISLDIYLRSNQSRHKKLILGWLFILASTLFPLGLIYTSDHQLANFIIFLSAILVSMGSFLLLISILSYFINFNEKYIYLYITLLIIISVTVFVLSGLESAFLMLTAFQTISIIGFPIMILYFRSKIKIILSKSLGLVTIIVIFLVHNFSTSIFLQSNVPDFPIYYETNEFTIILTYISAILLILIFIFLFIYIEHGIISTEKDKLKDNYSHDIGNLLQVILAASGIIEDDTTAIEEKIQKVMLINEKAKKAGDLIRKIRNS